MIIPFKYYIENGKVKIKTSDPIEAKSLFDRSQQRLKYIDIKKINKNNAPFILEDSYEVIRESSQSLMSLKGFKPYSHEATISFIKEYYSNYFVEYDLMKFDRFRKLRNNSIYRAEVVTKEDAKECFEYAKIFIEKIKKIILS